MAVSHPRTNPTVKPSTALNRRALRNWELRLGTIQTLLVSLALVGCVTIAFFIGLFSGRRAGLETALLRAQSSISRVPINASQEAETEKKSEQIVSDVYRTLQDRHSEKPAAVGAETVEDDMPELAKIETSQNVAPAGNNPVENASEKASAKLPEQLDTAALEPLDKLPPPQGKGAAVAETKVESRLVERESSKTGPNGAQTGALSRATLEDEVRAEKIEKAEKVENLAALAPATTALDSARLPKGWFAQVAAPKKREDADTMARQLKDSGFKVVIESAQVRGEAYFRILVGPESNREQADRLLQQLKRESYLKSDPFVRMVR